MSLMLCDVSHAYTPRNVVLNRVNVSVQPGDTIALMGPSGSGKTTMLAIMGLLLTPTSGEVVLDAERVRASDRRSAALRARSLAWVYQTVNVLSRRSAHDNIALPILARGKQRGAAASRVEAALAAVGLEGFGPRPVEELSGGEVQRVCIARAVAGMPRFLFADEPTGQLDAGTSETVLDALWAARQPATAVVVATHDHAVAARCARILVLRDGSIVEQTP